MPLKHWISAGVLVALLGTSVVAWADEVIHPVQNVQYNAKLGELWIESRDYAAITPQQVEHRPRRKDIIFMLPNMSLQPTPQVVNVTEDPIVKNIRLEQRAIGGIPAVRVEVDLYTNSPYLPFTLTPASSGSRLVFTHTTAPNDGEATIELRGQQPGFDNQSLIVETADKSLSFKPTDADVQQAKPSPEPSSATGALPADSEEFSVIQDVYYDEGNVFVVSQSHPIHVKRSFVLKEPNRYVVDISPAVLESRTQHRAITQSNPNIVTVKAGQFDENTVRIVTQFANEVPSVDLSQWNSNKVLKLRVGP